MNLSFPIGLVICFGLMVFGIVFGKDFGYIMGFIDGPSILITIGGTMAALFATFPTKVFMRMFQHFPILFGMRKQDPIHYINIMTELSQEARKKGLLALEDSVAQYDDAFLRDSIMLIVDAMEPDKVREQLENELNNVETRHAQSWELYDKGATLAPGSGMIGTLIGLVNMLADMNFEEEGGASKLAANMAVALITTFYGSVMANVIFIPIVTQLKVAHGEEMLCKELIIEGVVSIQAGENPRHINEKLLTFLTYKQRENASAQSESTD